MSQQEKETKLIDNWSGWLEKRLPDSPFNGYIKTAMKGLVDDYKDLPKQETTSKPMTIEEAAKDYTNKTLGVTPSPHTKFTFMTNGLKEIEQTAFKAGAKFASEQQQRGGVIVTDEQIKDLGKQWKQALGINPYRIYADQDFQAGATCIRDLFTPQQQKEQG